MPRSRCSSSQPGISACTPAARHAAWTGISPWRLQDAPCASLGVSRRCGGRCGRPIPNAASIDICLGLNHHQLAPRIAELLLYTHISVYDHANERDLRQPSFAATPNLQRVPCWYRGVGDAEQTQLLAKYLRLWFRLHESTINLYAL